MRQLGDEVLRRGEGDQRQDDQPQPPAATAGLADSSERAATAPRAATLQRSVPCSRRTRSMTRTNCQARPIGQRGDHRAGERAGAARAGRRTSGANTHASTPMGSAAAAQTPAMPPRAQLRNVRLSGDVPAGRCGGAGPVGGHGRCPFWTGGPRTSAGPKGRSGNRSAGRAPPRASGRADPDLDGVVRATPSHPVQRVVSLPRGTPAPLAGVSPAAALSRDDAAWPHRRPLSRSRPPGDGPAPASMPGWRPASPSSPSCRCSLLPAGPPYRAGDRRQAPARGTRTCGAALAADRAAGRAVGGPAARSCVNAAAGYPIGFLDWPAWIALFSCFDVGGRRVRDGRHRARRAGHRRLRVLRPRRPDASLPGIVIHFLVAMVVGELSSRRTRAVAGRGAARRRRAGSRPSPPSGCCCRSAPGWPASCTTRSGTRST